MVLGRTPRGWYVIQATGGARCQTAARHHRQYSSYSGDTTGRRYPMDVDGDGKMDIVLAPTRRVTGTSCGRPATRLSTPDVGHRRIWLLRE